MKSFTHTYVTLADVCEHNKLDYDATLYQISNSQITFGTNSDTLIHGYMLNTILDIDKDLDFGDFDDDILVSLGS